MALGEIQAEIGKEAFEGSGRRTGMFGPSRPAALKKAAAGSRKTRLLQQNRLEVKRKGPGRT